MWIGRNGSIRCIRGIWVHQGLRSLVKEDISEGLRLPHLKEVWASVQACLTSLGLNLNTWNSDAFKHATTKNGRKKITVLHFYVASLLHDTCFKYHINETYFLTPNTQILRKYNAYKYDMFISHLKSIYSRPF